MNKTALIYFSIALILITIYAIVVFFVVSPPEESPEENAIPTPVPVNESDEQKRPQHIMYEGSSSQRLRDIVSRRPQLSSPDQQIRNNLIRGIGGRSGVLEDTQSYKIEYLQSPDVFMVEIKTIDITQAKKDATQWFRSEGLTQSGVCYLPVVFYLNAQSSESAAKLNAKFNPLPEGC